MRTIFLLLTFFYTTMAIGQVGIGTTSPAASAALDVTSTSKGFLPPRMSWTQIQAIPNPAIGLTVFDIGSNVLRIYTSSGWTVFGPQMHAVTDPPGEFSATSQKGTGLLHALCLKIGKQNSNYVYVSGYFNGTVSIGQFTITAGVNNIFLGKFDSSGNPVWLKSFSCANNSSASAIELDSADNIYLTGFFGGTIDFGPSLNTVTAPSSTGFFARFDNNGNSKWVRTITGASSVELPGLAVCGAYLYFDGDFRNSTANFNGTTMTNSAFEAGFVGKVDTATGQYGTDGWIKQITPAGTGSVKVDAIAAYGTGVLATGYFTNNTIFPGNATPKTTTGNADGFVALLDNTGTTANVVTIDPTGAYLAEVTSIGIDAAANIYYGLIYNGGNPDLNPGAGTLTAVNAGGFDVALVKLSSSFAFQWGNTISSTGDDLLSGLTVDSAGDITTLGSYSANLNFTGSTFVLNYVGTRNAFLARFDKSGNLGWATVAANTSIATYTIQYGVGVKYNGKVAWISSLFSGGAHLGFGGNRSFATGFNLVRYEE